MYCLFILSLLMVNSLLETYKEDIPLIDLIYLEYSYLSMLSIIKIS